MNIDELAAAQSEQEDYTKVSKGGTFKKTLPEAGACVLRFREYIELGLCKLATKDYPKKKPGIKARFVFELCTPKHAYTVGEGEDAKTFRHQMAITLAVSDSEKSNYIKLFKMLNYSGKYKVPAQALGNAYKAEIFHVFDPADMEGGKPKADAKPMYANLNKGISYGDYTLEPARIVDALADTITELKVPELMNPRKLFIWGMPNKECWDSIFIDGEYTKEVDGKEQTFSKNWLQNKILEALDYEGSKLQEMLLGQGESLDDLPMEEPKPTEPTEAPADDDLEALLGV
jgi:hypothetical protein